MGNNAFVNGVKEVVNSDPNNKGPVSIRHITDAVPTSGISRIFNFFSNEDRNTRIVNLFSDPDYNTRPTKEWGEFTRDHLGGDFQILSGMSDKGIISIIKYLEEQGPLSMGNKSGDACLVHEPGQDFDTKDKIIFELSGIDSYRLKPIPGTYDDWMKIIGNHEGEHCNQFADHQHKPGNFGKYSGEIGADRESFARLKAEGRDDLAQAFIDVRSLRSILNQDYDMKTGFHGDPLHDTGILIAGGTISHQSYEAATGLWGVINKTVNDKLGKLGLQDLHRLDLDTIDKPYLAENLVRERPDAYMRILKTALDEGAFDKGNPSTKEYIKAATDAWGRLGTPDKPLEPKVPIDQLVERDSRYIIAANIMENVRRGYVVEGYDRTLIQNVVGNKNTPQGNHQRTGTALPEGNKALSARGGRPERAAARTGNARPGGQPWIRGQLNNQEYWSPITLP